MNGKNWKESSRLSKFYFPGGREVACSQPPGKYIPDSREVFLHTRRPDNILHIHHRPPARPPPSNNDNANKNTTIKHDDGLGRALRLHCGRRNKKNGLEEDEGGDNNEEEGGGEMRSHRNAVIVLGTTTGDFDQRNAGATGTVAAEAAITIVVRRWPRDGRRRLTTALRQQSSAEGARAIRRSRPSCITTTQTTPYSRSLRRLTSATATHALPTLSGGASSRWRCTGYRGTGTTRADRRDGERRRRDVGDGTAGRDDDNDVDVPVIVVNVLAGEGCGQRRRR